MTFKAFLAIFWCYDYGTYLSEAVERIAADEKGYHNTRCALWFAAYPQEVSYQDTSDVAKKTARNTLKFAQKMEQ